MVILVRRKKTWAEDLRLLETISQGGPGPMKGGGAMKDCQAQFSRNQPVVWSKTVTTAAHCLLAIDLLLFKMADVLSGP